MCTERKATGLFVLASFLCDNEVEYNGEMNGESGIVISIERGF